MDLKHTKFGPYPHKKGAQKPNMLLLSYCQPPSKEWKSRWKRSWRTRANTPSKRQQGPPSSGPVSMDSTSYQVSLSLSFPICISFFLSKLCLLPGSGSSVVKELTTGEAVNPRCFPVAVMHLGAVLFDCFLGSR
ncbi:hypothetical protein NE237_008279 [Protea cynaroides]|uniref:Uncharacterized protein n=1 Tax=Protea cynaroides TaxID=273540 RepID=A0A9Q0GM18_9MAGN|nr:hypothetical protein NE237_008279 [Protea cynaroides]